MVLCFLAYKICIESPLTHVQVKDDCAVPENIHTPPTEGIGIPGGVGVGILQGQKI